MKSITIGTSTSVQKEQASKMMCVIVMMMCVVGVWCEEVKKREA
jgi:hypothetical protein